jgi:tryptophan synthase alpha subunit
VARYADGVVVGSAIIDIATRAASLAAACAAVTAACAEFSAACRKRDDALIPV